VRKWSNYISDSEEWSDRCVEDPQWVAECLSRIGRFGGQHPTASVLAHSLEVFERLLDEPPQVQLWGLYHDAHEILTSDVPRPFKTADMCRFQIFCDALLQEKLGILVIESVVEIADTKQGDLEHELWNQYFGIWTKFDVDKQVIAFVERVNLMKGFLR